MKTYRLRRDRFEHKAGAVAYEFWGHDYGCRREDERVTGQPHMTMTSHANGEGPFWTCPTADLEPTI